MHWDNNFRKIIAGVLILGSFAVHIFSIQKVFASASVLDHLSDTLSRLKASTAADHEIIFISQGGIGLGESVVLTFSSDFTGITSLDAGDYDIATGGGDCTGFSEQRVNKDPDTDTWGVAETLSNVVTLLAPTSGGGTLDASRCLRVRIGLNATDTSGGSGPGDEQISNGAVDNDDYVEIDTTQDLPTVASIDVITDDQVVVSGSIDQAIIFSISDNAIGFGTLSSTTGRWATVDASGTNASAGSTPTEANFLTILTNAPSGYSITYKGATLTSGANTIAPATISSDSNGTPGTPQFALAASTDGDATIASGYQRGTNTSWNFVANTTTTLVSETTYTTTETISLSYLANIAALTPPGTYSTTITYIATGNF